MSLQHATRLRLGLCALATLAVLGMLLQEHLNGGVQSHHFLHRADMPAISNAWSALLLPVLTWFMTGRIHQRMIQDANRETLALKDAWPAFAGFLAALLFGVLLSTAFTQDYKSLSGYLFRGMLLLAIVLPLYRAQYLLGFVWGMSATFGAVLPAVVGALVASLSAVLHVCAYPYVMRLWTRFKPV